MNKKPPIPQTTVANGKSDGLTPLIAEIRQLVRTARHAVASSVNTIQVLTNFEIGRRIVEHEQGGEKRAGYGKELLKGLSARLTGELGRGFSEDNLALMRKFYLVFPDRLAISETASRKLEGPEKPQKPAAKSTSLRISEKVSRKSPFTLIWSHYLPPLEGTARNEAPRMDPR